MNSSQALSALIESVSMSSKSVSFGYYELQQWQDGVLKAFVAAGLLTKGTQTQSLECAGCENHCYMPIYFSEDSRRAFIVCDDPYQQSRMGRINVPLPRLQQWQASAKQFALVVAVLLGMSDKPDYQNETASYKLGMLKGDKGWRWLTLRTQPLLLEANRQTVPIADLLCFSDYRLEIDSLAVEALLNATPSNTGNDYTPNTSKREASKQDTQAMYQDWRDTYQALLQKHPRKPDTWYSNQIAKLPISQGRQAETIRKHMKK